VKRFALLVALICSSAFAQEAKPVWPVTTAEATNYAKTSSYADVMAFLRSLEALNAPMRIRLIGKSTLGKDLPMVVVHRNPNITPTLARRQGLPVIYIQANIHAGEVEGKEVCLMLMREFAQNQQDRLLDKLVMVFVPIYNIDGNDKWGSNKANRGHQDGPDPVGERANGQGLDLNRDCMKAESPEMQAVLKHIYTAWDPDVIMDLHTTNGTRHGYELTYSPGLNPTGDPDVFKFTVDLLAKIRKEPSLNGGYRFFDYGDAVNRNGKPAFSTFAAEPRYVTNYASVRNRIGILSEAASFQPFKTRVLATRVFVRSVLSEIAAQSRKVLQLTRRADERMVMMGQRGAQVGVAYDFEARGSEKVILEVERPAAEIDHMKAPTAFRLVEMPIYDRFKVTRLVALPKAYYVPRSAVKTIELLRLHGIVIDDLSPLEPLEAQRMAVKEASVATASFQGHRLVKLTGDYSALRVENPSDYLAIYTAQPLGLLAFHLLDPESTDGVIAWGHFGETWSPGGYVPILKSK
jgi:hypothetical protein